MATGHIPTVEIHFGFVREGIFHRVIVEILVDFITPVVAPSLGLGLDWPGILHPATLIDIVYEEITERAAA